VSFDSDDARPIPQRRPAAPSRVPVGAPGHPNRDQPDRARPDHAEAEARAGRPAEAAYTVDTRRKLDLAARRERAAQSRRLDERAAGPRQSGMPPAPRRRRVRLRRVVAVLLVVGLAWLAFMVAVPLSAWNGVTRVDASPTNRPAGGKGRNFLLVGSDSRAGLTDAQARDLGLDTEDVGHRTDSIILVHVSDSGAPASVISIPRDSYVKIPGRDSNKINAAFAFGGAELLVATVEQATGLRVDGFLEVGFGGFAAVVDSVGGVEICVAAPMKDELASLDIPAGCQLMNGRTALGYVRSRHTDARGDLGRAERQRQFLGAIIKKAMQPSTALVPWRYKAFSDAAGKGLTVGDGTSLLDCVRVLQALRDVGNGDGVSLQVPVENPSFTVKGIGSTVKWNDAQAKALFQTLKDDRPVTAPAPTK